MAEHEDSDVEFLNSYFRKLQDEHDRYDRSNEIGLTANDLAPSDAPLQTSKDDERAARIVDRLVAASKNDERVATFVKQHGLDGNHFRDILPLYPARSDQDFSAAQRKLWKKMNLVPKVIAAVESAENAPAASEPDDPTDEQWTEPMTRIAIGEYFVCSRNSVNEKILKEYELELLIL